MTPLQKKIIDRITGQGPLDIGQYMSIAMADPEHGYYNTADPLGRAGDFITAPETSQMFGEIIAIWALAAWQGLGRPAPFLLCEAGPGHGTLMDDILRTLGKLAPECIASACIHLVETSPRLAAMQKEKLRSHAVRLEWIENVADLPALPLVLIANELFDVLPVRQYVADRGGFRERMVCASQDGGLCFISGPLLDGLAAGIAAPAETIPVGTIVEISPARLALARQISRHIAGNRGAALIIDYGALEPGFGDTLQAVSNHSFCDPLENPGGCDLTSHVDFAALAQTARASGCHIAAMTQGAFLTKLGLLERAGSLGANRGEAFRQQLVADVERLAAPDQMGDLFKVLCIADSKTDMPPFHWQTPAANAQDHMTTG